MTYPHYPETLLERLRMLCSRREERGVSIHPKNRAPEPPAEVVHEESAIIPALAPGKVHVLEWSRDGSIDRHRVDLW